MERSRNALGVGQDRGAQTPPGTPRWRLYVMGALVIMLGALTMWVYQPVADPYAGLPRDQPHPRSGGRVLLEGSEKHVVHAPNLDVPRHPEGPTHWQKQLDGKTLAEVTALIGTADHEATASSGRKVRFWWNFCCADDEAGRWTVHLMIDEPARPGQAGRVRFIGGGGRIQGEAQPVSAPSMPPGFVPAP